MTIVLMLNGSKFPAWTITDPAHETEEWIEDNAFFLDGKAWNALPPEIDDDGTIRSALYELEEMNSRCLERMIGEDQEQSAYFTSREEYVALLDKADDIISVIENKKREKGLSFNLVEALHNNIEARLAFTNRAREAMGLEAI